jgi:malate permease and related proteins
MVLELLTTFANVLAPVFLLVLFGYLAGPRLQLDSRTLSRFSYFLLTPAFTFDIMSKARVEVGLALRMTGYIVVIHLLCALLGFAIARLLRRPPQLVAAYILIAVFGNVGNFGLPIVRFRFPDNSAAMATATIYFLAIMIVAFIICVAAANWHRGGSIAAMIEVFKTPALLAVPPALLVNWLNLAYGFTLPPIITRPVELLAVAMIPTMVVALGCQLAASGIPRPNLDMAVASGVRLVGGPLLAFALAIPFGLAGLERSVGILQASMPAAVLVSIIAYENDLLPEFVTATVLFSTLASVLTLTIVVGLL